MTAVYCLLPVGYWMLAVVCWLLPVVCWMLPVVYWLLAIVFLSPQKKAFLFFSGLFSVFL